MKIEQLLVQHLYNTKEVTLQGIGTISLSPNVALPSENEKDFAIPADGISFEYNLKATEDNALISFIAQQTGKIKPLATADLDSYVILSKQFLNIGKPLTIEGIGTIQKNQQGDYEFIPGIFITPKIDDIPRQLREKRDESVSFESESKSGNSKRNLMIAVVILLIALIGLGIYYLLFYKSADEIPAAIPPVQTIDTPQTTTPDSSLLKPTATVDTNKFEVVIRQYATKVAAEKALTRFTGFGHNLSLFTEDSITYKLSMPFNRKLSDSLIVKDSLRELFLGQPYIKLQ